jgi:flagellar biosynthesis protein FliR
MTDPACAALVLLRVGAMSALLPSGGGVLTIRRRLGIAMILSPLVAPLIAGQTATLSSRADWCSAAFQQLLWGAFFGGAIHAWLGTFTLAGAWIVQISGWGTDVPASGDQDSAPGIVRLYSLLAAVTFFAMDGPNMAIRALLDSFLAAPISASPLSPSIAAELAEVLIQSVWLALGVASPVLTSLLAASLGVAAIQRAMPHVNLVRFQLAGNWLVLLLSVTLTLGLNLDHWRGRVSRLIVTLPQQVSQVQTPTPPD